MKRIRIRRVVLFATHQLLMVTFGLISWPFIWALTALQRIDARLIQKSKGSELSNEKGGIES